MPRWFNTDAPLVQYRWSLQTGLHYGLSPLDRPYKLSRLVQQQSSRVMSKKSSKNYCPMAKRQSSPNRSAKPKKSSSSAAIPVPPDDVQFLIDLGLLERDPAGG